MFLRRHVLATEGPLSVDHSQPATIAPQVTGELRSLLEKLDEAPRRRDFKTVPMILDSADLWDAEALAAISAYRGSMKQLSFCRRGMGRLTSSVTFYDSSLAPLRPWPTKQKGAMERSLLWVRFFVTGSSAKDQHPITEIISLTQEDEDRGEQRNRRWPNCQPKQVVRTVNSLHWSQNPEYTTAKPNPDFDAHGAALGQ